ncbi:MAG: DNA adenine methylase [Myxococcales bacterium]|nr:DNA adenine methylase [Myxococcales bacterium]
MEAALARARAFVEASRPDVAAEEALARAGSLLALLRGDCDIEKSLWGSPAGKKLLAKRIVAAIPKHRVYVEPFAGGAQVFWAKEPSEVEVLADRDPEIAFAFRFVKNLTPAKLARLKRRSWVGDAERFRKLYESEPEDDVERFYRFAYLAYFSFNKLRRGTMPDKHIGVEARFIDRLEKFAPRLKNVVVRCADYEDVVDEFDAPDTFLFLDPPYPGYEAEVGHDDWDEKRFGKALRRIDGKFLVTYGTRSEGTDQLFKGFHVARWRHTSGVGAHQGQGLGKSVTLVATNYRLEKAAEPQERQMLLPNITAADPVEKTIWGSPAGKKRLAARLVKLITPHKVYVEPFAGSAAVFFEKEPVEVEVLGDADPDIAFAFKAIKTLTDGELEALRKKEWVGRRTTFKALQEARPRNKVEKLYRFLYLSHFSYGKLRGKSYNPNAEGVEARTIDRIELHRDRLRAAKVRHAHYAELVKEFDGKDTFFFLDPPYPGHDVEIGEDIFDEMEFRKVLDGIKGRFLVTYGTRGKLDTKGFHVRKIRTPRSIRAMRGVGGPKTLPQLLIANYAITEKSLGGGWELDELLEVIDVEADAGDVPEVVRARVAALAVETRKLEVAEVHPERLRGVPDEELLSIHRRLHQLFGGNFAGNDRLSAADLKREDLVNAELFVQDELHRRGMEHAADDELAREAATLRRTVKRALAPVHPSGQAMGPEITLAEVLPHFQSFKLRAPFLYLVGGLANNGATKNDVDVLVRGDLPPELRKAIEFRLGRMLPPELSSRLQLLDDEYAGPFTSHVELADLVVEVRPKLDVKRMRLVEKQDDPLLDLPKERGPHPAVLQYHFRGRSVHGDLRLRVDDHLVGWTLSLQRPGAIADAVDTVEEARRIARSFSVQGDRYAKPLVAPAKVFAAPKARQPVVWLDVDGEVFGEGEVGATANEKGVIVAIDHPKVEWGLQKPFSHEYFFSGGQELNGILYFRLLTGQPGEPQGEIEAGRRSPEGEAFWTAFLSKELLPSVVKPRAVETRSMPPDGYSALPLSLERVTPKEHRYWEAKGEDARGMRDALVESGFFTADNIRLVDGEFRRVVQKLFLSAPTTDAEVEKARVIPFQQWGGSAKYARKLAARLPEHARYVEPFCGAAAVFFAKEPAREEVLADANPEVVFALRYIQRLSKKSFAALERYPWKVSRTGFERARASEPGSDAERVWKLIYGRLCTWGAKPNMSGFATIHDGQTYDLGELWKFQERLKGVRLVTQDWEKTLGECDGPGTLFFLDPPYTEEWAVGDGIAPEEIAAAVSKLKGDYVIAYTDSARARRALAKVGRPFTMRIPEGRSAGQWQKRSRLFVASCKLRKLDDVEWVDDDVPAEVEKQPREVDFTLSWQFWKGQTVIRAAPSRQVWHLALDRAGAGLDTWVLQADPLSGEERITAVATPRRSKELLAFDGDVAPGQGVGGDVLNDTKETPSTIRIQDRGRAVLLDDQRTFKKVRFEGQKLRGVFTLTAEEAGSDIWQLARGQDPGRAIPEAKAEVPVRDGVQIWDPARKDPDVDRAQLRPLAIFQPMKPAPRATNEFREVDAALAWATPEMLKGGIAIEPKFNGFRVVLEKAGDKVLVFTEDTKRDISPALPNLSAELAALPGDFILDGEFFDFDEAGDPVPRRELGEFRTDEARDDSRARVQVFDILYWRHRNLTFEPYVRRREVLDLFFEGRRLKHLEEVETSTARTIDALRRAIDRAAKIPGSEGAMLKLISSTYSLGGENDAWAKLKLVREVRALVYDRHPVKDAPDVYNFFGAVGPVPREEADRWKETVDVGGKLYAPVGKTFNAKLDANVGDVIRVEVTELLIDRAGGKQSITWFTPVVIDRTAEPPMSPEEVIHLAQPQEFKKMLAAALAKRIPLLKTGEERYVLGIVLEPETVDAQKDVYSGAEVRDAAHRFMEEYRNIGLMHRELLGDQVKILESYLAPVDFEVDGKRVKKGTWLLAARVLDNDLWKQIKDGAISGWSIGGNAIRTQSA